MFGMQYNDCIRQFLKKEEVYNKRIVDVGSFVINNTSPRFAIAQYEPAEYVGIDIIAGAGVDKVCTVEDFLLAYGEETFDIVFMSAIFEVAKDYKSVISSAKRLCKKNGIIILTARTDKHPENVPMNEYWRYEQEDMRNLFRDCNIVMEGNDAKFTEIFLKLVKPQEFVECNYDGIALYSPILKRRVICNEDVLNLITSHLSQDDVCHDFNEEKESVYFNRYVELEQLGVKRATDKSSLWHNYLNKYDMFLNHLRQEEFIFLELGVFHGSSVKMWSDYFRKAKIIGVDIDPECKQYASDRINILTGDLSNIKSLNVLASLKPSVIVDDASHIWSHQISALFELFPCLPSGGIYIMEDVGTSLNLKAYPGYNDVSVSAYDVLSQIAEVCTGGQELRVPREFQTFIEEIGKQVEMISFIRESCIMIKK